jgi:hypothetical protein
MKTRCASACLSAAWHRIRLAHHGHMAFGQKPLSRALRVATGAAALDAPSTHARRACQACAAVPQPSHPLALRVALMRGVPIKGLKPLRFCPRHRPVVRSGKRHCAPLFWLPDLIVDSSAHRHSLPRCRSQSSTIAQSYSSHHRTSIFSIGEPQRRRRTGELPPRRHPSSLP